MGEKKNESVYICVKVNNLVVKASAWKCLHIKPVSKVFQIRLLRRSTFLSYIKLSRMDGYPLHIPMLFCSTAAHNIGLSVPV